MPYTKKSHKSNKRKHLKNGGATPLPAEWYGEKSSFASESASKPGPYGRDLKVGPNASNLVGGKKHRKRSHKGGRATISTPASLASQKSRLNTSLSKLGARVQNGGSDWGFSQYSAGPINTPPQSEAQFRMFNKTTPYSVGSQTLSSADIDSVLCNKPVDGWSVGDSLIDNSAESYAQVGGKKRKSKKRSTSKKSKSKKSKSKKRSASKKSKSMKGGKKRSSSKKSKSKKRSVSKKSKKSKKSMKGGKKRSSPKKHTTKKRSTKKRSTKKRSTKKRGGQGEAWKRSERLNLRNNSKRLLESEAVHRGQHKKKGGNVNALTALGLMGLHEVAKRSPRKMSGKRRGRR